MEDSVNPLWGGNRVAHYLLFIGGPFLFFLIVGNFVGIVDRFGFSTYTVGKILTSHILGSLCLFLVTYGLFAIYHSKFLIGWQKLGMVILLMIVLYFVYGLLFISHYDHWSMGLMIALGSGIWGIIAILLGLLPSALTAILSDLFKILFLKFAPKRGRYYWMIVTVLIGVILSTIYGLGLKEGKDTWFFIDISLFCTLYAILFLSLQDYYKYRNNRLIKRSFDDSF